METAGSAPGFQLRGVMDALPVALYTTDAEGRLTYFNAAAERLSGRSLELGAHRWSITWKDFDAEGSPLAPEDSAMAAVLKGLPVKAGEDFIAERPDGTRFWFTSYPAAFRDQAGRITGGLNLLIDITDRKNAQSETEAQFRAIFETTAECVKIVAPDGTLLHMNSSGISMTGASSGDSVIGKSVYDLIAPHDRERFREFNERVCQGEPRLWNSRSLTTKRATVTWNPVACLSGIRMEERPFVGQSRRDRPQAVGTRGLPSERDCGFIG